MNPPRQQSPRKFWYKISVDSLKAWSAVLVLAVMAVAGFQGYRILRDHLLQREVEVVVGEAADQLATIEQEVQLSAYQDEYLEARQSLRQAEAEAEVGSLRQALREAERSRMLGATILSALRHGGQSVEARFLAVHGGVEYRRGERGEWQAARSRTVLYPGDYVKTSARSSAEIMLVDGTVYTVRSDTVILVDRKRLPGGGRGERAIGLEYGWVDLSTAGAASRVTTPEAEAEVARDSTAMVSYDQQTQESRYAAYTGSLEVTSDRGRKLRVAELQQVVAKAGTGGRVEALPEAPRPVEPPDDLELLLEDRESLVLAWEPVPGASGYALQVSRDRLFSENLIEDEHRVKTMATLGVQGTGAFVWRVADYDRKGTRGPWSAARRFRVASRREITG